MARRQGQLRLGAFFNPTGHHVASWRHPDAQADAGINFQHYVEIAQTAERGKFDMMFLADNVGVREANMEALSRSAQYIANFEPITLISALAAVTEPHRPHLHRVARATTSRSTSRASSPRSTTSAAAAPAGTSSPPAWRPRPTTSTATPTTATPSATSAPTSSPRSSSALWDSWDDDAFVRDKESGQFFDPAKLHALNHTGKHFKVQGPAQHPAPAAGPSGDRAGRHLRRRHGRGGALRRGDLHARI